MDEWIDRNIMKIVGTFMVGCLIFLAWVLVGFGLQQRVEGHCMALGWTRGVVTAGYTGYCVARTDQTDVVVPWKEAKRR